MPSHPGKEHGSHIKVKEVQGSHVNATGGKMNKKSTITTHGKGHGK